MFVSTDRNSPGQHDKSLAKRGRPRARQLGMRTESSGSLDASNPFYICHNGLYYYEYSGLVSLLGSNFLEAGCVAIRSKRDATNRKSWSANYVGPFDYLVCALAEFLRFNAAVRLRMPSDAAEWSIFTSWFSQQLDKRGLSEPSRAATRRVFNRLFELLRIRGVIPSGTELPLERRLSRPGESKFTVRGWKRKCKELPIARTPLQFVVHGRLHDYEVFREVGSAFLVEWVEQVKSFRFVINDPKTAARTYQICADIFGFLQAEKEVGRWTAFFVSLNDGDHRSLPAESWQRVLFAWRESVRYRKRHDDRGFLKLTSANNLVGRLSTLWKYMSQTGVVPWVLLERLVGSAGSLMNTPRRSLAQVVRGYLEAPEVGVLWKQFDKNEQAPAREYVAALVQELGAERVAVLTPTELAKAIVNLNNSRLDALRRCAEKEFIAWSRHWELGQKALEACSYEAEELLRLLDSPLLTAAERRRNSTALLNAPDVQVRLGNSLKYVLASRDGVVSGLVGRYHLIKRAFGGSYTFHAYLHPHKDVTNALWVMLMVDTAANCEVVREMPVATLRKSAKPGLMRVSLGSKGRAGMKSIQDTLSIEPQPGLELSCVQAIQAYEVMSSRYRAMAGAQAKGRLLLHEMSGEVSNPAAYAMLSRFKAFCKRHDELSGLALLPSMIRTSALMRVFHSQPARRMEASQAQGDHGSLATTHRYTNNFPAQVVYEAQIIDFARRWQSVVIVTIDKAAERLGLTPQQFNHLLSDAARTGLGVACLDAYKGVQPETVAGEHCHRQDRCWDCKMRYLVGSVDHIVDLLLFNEYLERESESNKQNAQWLSRWRPWLVFTDVALSKMRTGETADAYLQAQKLVPTRRATYSPLPLV